MANSDLINWTMQKARHLRPEHRMPGENEGSHLLDKLLEVFGGDPLKPKDMAIKSQEVMPPIASAPNVQLTDNRPMVDDEALASPLYAVLDWPEANTALRVSTQATPLARADVVPMSALLKAILEPGIYTDPADRERAILLRWVLRDIKANRLKLSPVDQQDLHDLIEMGLVELRNDIPALTNAGINAII